MSYNWVKKSLLWLMIFYIPVYIVLFFVLSFLYGYFFWWYAVSEAQLDAKSFFIVSHIFYVCILNIPFALYWIIVLIKNRKIKHLTIDTQNKRIKNFGIIFWFILMPLLSLLFMHISSNPALLYKEWVSLYEQWKYEKALPKLEVAYDNFQSDSTIYLFVNSLENVGDLDRAINILDLKLNDMKHDDLYEIYLEKKKWLFEKKQKINFEYTNNLQKEILSVLPVDLRPEIDHLFSKFNDLCIWDLDKKQIQNITNTIFSLIKERTVTTKNYTVYDIVWDDLELIILPSLCDMLNCYSIKNDMCFLNN